MRRSAPVMADQAPATAQSAPPARASRRRAGPTPLAAAAHADTSPRRRQPLGLDAGVTEELVAIVVRAGQLGFCPWRVGIALRFPPMELAWICTRPQPDASTAKTLTATLRGASWQAPSSRVGTSSGGPGGADA